MEHKPECFRCANTEKKLAVVSGLRICKECFIFIMDNTHNWEIEKEGETSKRYWKSNDMLWKEHQEWDLTRDLGVKSGYKLRIKY